MVKHFPHFFLLFSIPIDFDCLDFELEMGCNVEGGGLFASVGLKMGPWPPLTPPSPPPSLAGSLENGYQLGR
ncbi:hypothetical protein V6N13_043115 [Hibiscus sabdariffa]|uniref:Uncharacterized protein n=1 Tax=Hibiscus sabdariffa TaxID=183260 RepID=A0ABR2G2K7_9ROSI